jgi:D-glutamate cyclase
MTDRLAQIDAIEAVIQQDVGRNIVPLFAAARGGLRGAVSALAEAPGPVGMLTGFYVPGGTPPAAETDGPVAAGLLARALQQVGIAARLCTDSACASACSAALRAAGANDVAIDVVADPGAVTDVIATWRAQGVRLAVAIERCGRTADGTARNMRAEDISDQTVLLDDLFVAGPWETIAVGDGGNEIGMGSVPPELIAEHVAHGEVIACVTPARHLVLAGVSHWGAYGLIGGLAVLRVDWRAALLAALDPELDRRILEMTVRSGPAVDGVTRRQTLSIDTLDMSQHCRVLTTIRDIVRQTADR